MKSLFKSSLSLIISITSTGSLAQTVVQTARNKVVYGLDNRVEVYEAPASMKKMANATAMMVMGWSMTEMKDNQGNVTHYTLASGKLKDDGICSDARFASQPNPGSCSGFLVGPDLLVTAGHCEGWRSPCEGQVWIFDYALDKDTQAPPTNISPANVFRCKEVINVKEGFFDYDTLSGDASDHALIRLDRVVGREPVKYRTEGKISNKEDIVVIGHPSGLPTKVSDGSNVRNNEQSIFFIANLDTFGGNSGSSVFNVHTSEVEGILVRGEEDYVPNAEKGCQEVKLCEDDACRGEHVTRITEIYELAMREKILNAAKTGDLAMVNEYITNKGWINLYDNAGTSILMNAALAPTPEVITTVMKNPVELKHTNAQGQNVLHFLAQRKFSMSGFRPVVDELIKAGVNINKRDANGESPLDVASSSGNLSLMYDLLKAGAEITAK